MAFLTSQTSQTSSYFQLKFYKIPISGFNPKNPFGLVCFISTRDFWMFFGFWPSVKRTTIDTLWPHDHPLSDFFLPECECKWIATLLSILKRIQYYSWTTDLDSSLRKKIMKIFKTDFFLKTLLIRISQ